MLYDKKHPKWKDTDNKAIYQLNKIFNDNKAPNDRNKLIKFINEQGYELKRHNKHDIYTRTFLNKQSKEQIEQVITISTTSNFYKKYWPRLKRYETEKIQTES